MKTVSALVGVIVDILIVCFTIEAAIQVVAGGEHSFWALLWLACGLLASTAVVSGVIKRQ